MKTRFDSIESVITDLRKGKMVIVVDDADRENEGDLVMAGQHVTPAAVNFMAKFGRGLICVPTTGERLQQLGIDRMVQQNRESFRTDFQVSVDAAHGIGSGISAADRAKTIEVMSSPTAVPDDLVQPGHIFPLRARSGGVLQRAGHTEAAVDLVKLAGCRPIGVICEIMRDDGAMARLPELTKFGKKHRLKICTIEELIKFRRAGEKLVEPIEIIKMPTDYGDFDLHLYRSKIDGQHHLALVRGEISGKKMFWCASTANVSPATSSVRAVATADRNCIAPCNKWPTPAVAWCFTCGRKDAASVSARKFRPTNYRSRVTTRSRPTKNSASTWICANTVSAHKSSAISA